ncbi:tetratricopeptide repeat protein [Neolewinella litorea]|uniref:Tetratricopeptide repeat protein n=1 Tax=Neolewinella litorea TaxID=2562452 RepID=A0A4S4NED9_9BACT|nr:tetratricopeptide repeat protein [Neolewinella litorea]THH37902.1 tetratricopeptide repeat protein [Neolewinella litorea]
MKFLHLILLLVIWSGSLAAQIDLTPDEWRQDLRFLQRTIHEEYPFLFKKVSAEDFDAAVEELYTDIPELEDHEVVVGLARIVALFGYGHTNIWLSGWGPDNPFGFREMPYRLYWFSDGIFVQGAHREYAEAVGARVTHVEGMPVEKALEAIRPVVSVENEQFFKSAGPVQLANPAVLHAQGITPELKDEITLTLEKDGEPFDVTFAPVDSTGDHVHYGLVQEDEQWLDARDNATTPLWLKHLDRPYFYEYLPDSKTVYVRQSKVRDDTTQILPDFYAEVFQFVEDNEVDRLVLDLRLNGGGNNYKNKDVIRGIIQTEKIDQPGKLFVIIGRRTFSAAQNLVNELDNYTNAIFVGEPTSENVNFYGDNRPVELPNSKIEARLSFAWWQDKPQWENDDWQAPHIAVDMSSADYRDNRDPSIEAILNYQGDISLADPMDHLERLYAAGKIEEVRSEAHRLVKDPRYRYYPFERNLNRAGYQLLGQGQKLPALMVFQLNAELFPESPNVWDSLAEGYWKAGNHEKAVEYYQKAIDMDPEGPTAVNARAMLGEIRGDGAKE